MLNVLKMNGDFYRIHLNLLDVRNRKDVEHAILIPIESMQCTAMLWLSQFRKNFIVDLCPFICSKRPHRQKKSCECNASKVFPANSSSFISHELRRSILELETDRKRKKKCPGSHVHILCLCIFLFHPGIDSKHKHRIESKTSLFD